MYDVNIILFIMYKKLNFAIFMRQAINFVSCNE